MIRIIILFALILSLAIVPVAEAKGSSGGRSGSRSSSPSRSTTAKPATPKATSSSPAQKPTKPKEPKGKLKKTRKNSHGQEVAYRHSSRNWFTNWVLFGWLWGDDDDDKCYDKDYKRIDCWKD